MIKQRLESRDQAVYPKNILNVMQEEEISYAEEISSKLNIELINSKDIKRKRIETLITEMK